MNFVVRNIDALIGIGLGLIICYYAFGGPRVSTDPAVTARWMEWHRQWGRTIKIGGVCMVAGGMLKLVAG